MRIHGVDTEGQLVSFQSGADSLGVKRDQSVFFGYALIFGRFSHCSHVFELPKCAYMECIVRANYSVSNLELTVWVSKVISQTDSARVSLNIWCWKSTNLTKIFADFAADNGDQNIFADRKMCHIL